MKLLIVESPTKTKTVKKYLPEDEKFLVKASIGHIRDLPKSNKDAIDIESDFKPRYEINPDKKKIVAELIAAAKKAEQILLAPDPDREGEAIAWHIAELLVEAGIPKEKIKRITFNEITRSAVREALKYPRDIDQNLRRAQEARRVLDRLFGYDLSGLIWKKLRYGLSAGRVQSPALRILVERERQIQAFIPDVYWTITASLQSEKHPQELPFVCAEKFTVKTADKTPSQRRKEIERMEKLVNKILNLGRQNPWQITDLKETSAKRSPRPPFTTSTLQQAASSRLGFAPARTMALAQKLYSAGHITYMRTDSTALSKEALGQIAEVIKRDFGDKYYKSRVFKSRAKNAQEAHEAIRPTDCGRATAGETADEQRLYKLIRIRTLASQMADAQIRQTKITAKIDNEDFPDFFVRGAQIVFPGWLKLDVSARGEETELPALKVGDNLKCRRMESEQKETSPPKRYTEAGLVKELETRGIGRPSTYAGIIKTIQTRGYVRKEGRTLIPTLTGMVVSEFLEKNFDKYISDDFTAGMEDELDEIAAGRKTYLQTVRNFWEPFHAAVSSKADMKKLTDLGKADEKFKCPLCGGPMVIKLSKNDTFLSCAKFPECTGARKADGTELDAPQETGEDCPDCGAGTAKNAGGKLIVREGRYGKFVSCSNYPKCKYIKEDEEEAAKKKTGVKCPACQKGEMVERRGRFGVFYSCSEYPRCKNAIKARPTGKICRHKRRDRDGEECGALMMEGTKTIPERCSDKTCPNHRPDKLVKKK